MEEKKFFEKTRSFFYLLLFTTLIFFSSNFFSFSRDTGMLIINPINDVAFSSSESFKDFFTVFGNIHALKEDYHELQKKYLVLTSELKTLELLKEENAVLQEQLGIKEEDDELIFSRVLYQDIEFRSENLLLNKGEDDGVEKGDVVVFGNIYVGLIVETTSKTSKVRLPTSRASSIKVMILQEDSFLNGLALGYSNSIKIENIDVTGDLEDGYEIFINDPKIREQLYLGSVNSIGEDSTNPLRSCGVELPLRYTDLKFVFVKKL